MIVGDCIIPEAEVCSDLDAKSRFAGQMFPSPGMIAEDAEREISAIEAGVPIQLAFIIGVRPPEFALEVEIEASPALIECCRASQTLGYPPSGVKFVRISQIIIVSGNMQSGIAPGRDIESKTCMVVVRAGNASVYDVMAFFTSLISGV